MDNESFLYLIDFVVANAWLLYKVAHKKAYPKKKWLPLYEFKRSVSLSWMMHNKRPGKRRLHTPRASKVPPSVRYDKRKHLPKCTDGYEKRKRCEHCTRQTNVFCKKCKVHLCLSHRRNCFIPFHGDSSDSDSSDSDSENVDSGSNHANSDANDADSESNPVFSDSDIDEQQPEENAAANETPEI